MENSQETRCWHCQAPIQSNEIECPYCDAKLAYDCPECFCRISFDTDPVERLSNCPYCDTLLFCCPDCQDLCFVDEDTDGKYYCESCGIPASKTSSLKKTEKSEKPFLQQATLWEYSNEPETQELHPVIKYPLMALFAILPLISYIGAFAFHIWTTYLFYSHWGGFAGVIALCTPLVAELVAAIAVFWWGMHYYLFGILAFFLLMLIAVTTEGLEAKTRKLRLYSAAATAALILACFASVSLLGYFAYKDLLQHRSAVKEDRLEEVNDLSAAVCLTLAGSVSEDISVRANTSLMKKNLRKELDSLSPSEQKRVLNTVNDYLSAIALYINDMQSYVATGQGAFEVSSVTRQKIESLPEFVQQYFRRETQAFDIESIQELNIGERMRAVHKLKSDMHLFWEELRKNYKNILERTAPTRAALLSR